MQTYRKHSVLAEMAGTFSRSANLLRQLLLVVGGVALLALSAKISVPMWPVPITMGTFAVLGLGAVYGPRLGLVTILIYLVCGACGMNVFMGSSAGNSGLSYMMGTTGGYLAGYVLATLVLGFAARVGWDRAPLRMAGAMLVGNVVIYIPGLLWLGVSLGWDKPLLQWGVMPFLIGDALKLLLAAALFPAAWKAINAFQK